MNSLRTHDVLDARSLALHRLTADVLRKHPERLAIAKANLDRLEAIADPHCKPYLDQWRVAVNGGLESSIALMISETEQGNALRQAAPFGGVLSHAERFSFFRSWEQQNHATR